MKQALIKQGVVFSEEVPPPQVDEGEVLIRVMNSCISAGTEVKSINSTGKSVISKAFEQPDKIKKAFELVKKKGLKSVVSKVKDSSNAISVTGYSVSGIVIEVGKNVTEFVAGDRVAAAGAGFANHAGVVSVPKNLVIKIPSNLGFKEASTVTLGGIALHGVRRANLHIGEFAVVVGTGIIGLITCQLLVSAGIRVAAIDIDDRRLKIAEESGVEITINPLIDDQLSIVNNWTGGYGVDTVIFTASVSNSSALSNSFKMCKRKGRVVLVGVSGMEIKREDIYPKELDFSISTSYGPGRYDRSYEEKGVDYPYSFVRWTENRNMQEYIRLLSTNSINVSKLIDGIFSIDEVTNAFNTFKQQKDKPLIVIIKYKNEIDTNTFKKDLVFKKKRDNENKINVALVGTGSFALGTHVPNLLKLKEKYNLYTVLSRKGTDAMEVARKFNVNNYTTNFDDILNDKNVDLVLICTRHDSHASLTLKALRAGKNVFVEKPLAINEKELEEINSFYNENPNAPLLMVGYNRRYSKYAQEIKTHVIKRINPLFIRYRMNAGYVPKEHWVHDNGGRIIGEAGHIIDLMNFFVESPISSISKESLSFESDKFSSSDNKSFVIKYTDGSVCSIDYFATGARDFPKEYMELHFDGKTIELLDYKKINGYGIKIKEISSNFSEKGQLEEFDLLYKYLTGSRKGMPVELTDLAQTSKATFIIANSY